MEVKKNFDWSITNRKLVIFIPNCGRKSQLEFSLSCINTTVPKSDWVVIIGNDGVDINFDHLVPNNVYYFSLIRNSNTIRNGCFIRNYAIKQCQSQIFLQKDPEIVIIGDFIENVIKFDKPWRVGNIYVLNRNASTELMVERNFDSLKYYECKKIDPVIIYDAKFAKHRIAVEEGRVGFSSYFHYAYAIKTDILRGIGGYDEGYTSYGYEDSDMFCRLIHLKQYLTPDYQCTAIHLYHDSVVDIPKLLQMGDIFSHQDPTNVVRNNGKWGEGG